MDIIKAEIARKRKLLEDKNLVVIYCVDLNRFVKFPNFLLIFRTKTPSILDEEIC